MSISESPLSPDIYSPSQTIGPLYGFALMFEGSEKMVADDDPAAVELIGRVTDAAGPVAWPEVMVEVWNGKLWARGRTDEAGEFHFLIRKPEPQPEETIDGERVAPFLNVTVFARGLLKHAYTRLYFPDEAEANANDPVLALVDEEDRSSLVAEQDGDRLRFDICLQGPEETVFFEF
jgi:protocatechuate 3,4-dioxygenase, alpha subunit